MRSVTKSFWYSAAVLAGGCCTVLAQSANTDPGRDVPVIRQVLNDVLSSNSNGAGTNWLNPQTHDYGAITRRTSHAASNGRQCRASAWPCVVNDNERTYAGAACKGT